jgi:hypothetical protein
MGLDPYVRRSRHHPHRTVQCQTGVEEGAPFLLRVQRKPAAEATPEQWPQYPELIREVLWHPWHTHYIFTNHDHDRLKCVPRDIL